MSLPSLDRYLAIDCEMVGSRSGQALAKVGIVDHAGAVVLETFVFVHPHNIVDYRSSSSGIKPGDLASAPTFEAVRKQVKEIVNGKILVGHAIFNDLAVLEHRHPYEDVRDTALYYPFRRRLGVVHEGQYPSLKKLTADVLGDVIQRGEGHDPIEDARATMALFQTVREAYETALINDEDVVAGVPSAYARWYW
ncbi:hypothetical protein Q5752_003831 [Cryptotrichosporon argae]